MIKKMYRAKEAAEYLGVAISTIWLYAKQSKLTPIKLSPRVTVFYATDLERLINNTDVGGDHT